MRKQKPKSETETPAKTNWDSIFGGFFTILILCGILYLMFWPTYCEGVVSKTEFQYGIYRRNVITFEDGRRMNFNGAMPIPIEKGKRYKFSYNWLDYVYSAKEME